MEGENENAIKIENVVASTSVEQEIDLKRAIVELEDSHYEPKQFPGLVYRTRDPKIAALIFRSGKIVCTGAKSIDEVHLGLKKIFSKLEALGVTIPDDPKVIIQNIVASANLYGELNLNAIAIGLGLENIEYEPEQFPGLVYRLKVPKVVVLLFGSGKLVVTGGKHTSDVTEAVEKIKKELIELGLL